MPPRSAQARDAPVARAQIEAWRAFDPAQPGGRLQHERVGEGVVVCGLGQPGLHLAETTAAAGEMRPEGPPASSPSAWGPS